MKKLINLALVALLITIFFFGCTDGASKEPVWNVLEEDTTVEEGTPVEEVIEEEVALNTDVDILEDATAEEVTPVDEVSSEEEVVISNPDDYVLEEDGHLFIIVDFVLNEAGDDIEPVWQEVDEWELRQIAFERAQERALEEAAGMYAIVSPDGSYDGFIAEVNSSAYGFDFQFVIENGVKVLEAYIIEG